jgi:uncharacterized protein (DUF2235 family)
MPKNIVVLCDGTGNELKTRGNTNVVRLSALLEKGDPDRQVTFYDPGVGTMGSQGALTIVGRGITKVLGLAFGYGLKANVAEGYKYIMDHYEPDDRIFLFGFSRGAYTARAIAGFINHIGLLPAGNENLIPYAMKLFWHDTKRPITDKEWDLAAQFSGKFARPDFRRKKPDAIAYVGVWDTVNATGSLRRTVVLPYTASLELVRKARHAVAIDELRRKFRPNLFKFDTKEFKRRENGELKEAWFAGVHTYVGGDHELCDITLQWITDGAIEQGLLVDDEEYKKYQSLPDSTAEGPLGKAKAIWRLLGFRRRKVVPSPVFIHESVKVRQERIGYAPPNLPSDHLWEPWPR